MKAIPAGMVKVAGAGAAVALLVVRFTTAPPAGAGPVSWIETVCVSPADAGSTAAASDATVGGVAGTTKEPVDEKAVWAGTPGAESPCVESTCQYFVPAVNDRMVHCGPVIWLLTNSMLLNPGSVATSST